MRVVITGAAGAIGREIAAELARDHELRLVDKTPLPKQSSIVADLARCSDASHWKRWWKTGRCSWRRAFEGTDVVIHLAANVDTEAVWEELLPNNVDATWNVIETAARYRIPRIIFASSNWAVKAMERKLAPACYRPDGPKINSDVPPCPINPYGLSKAYGELAGRMAIDSQKIQSFVAVRIGYFGTLQPNNEELHSMWIGAADIRRLFRCCVEAEFDGFHIVYGTSAQKTAPYDLTYTSQLLSWFPRQLPSDPAAATPSPS